jgi:hypothetical protein
MLFIIVGIIAFASSFVQFAQLKVSISHSSQMKATKIHNIFTELCFLDVMDLDGVVQFR